jgi:hypothetical protein
MKAPAEKRINTPNPIRILKRITPMLNNQYPAKRIRRAITTNLNFMIYFLVLFMPKISLFNTFKKSSIIPAFVNLYIPTITKMNNNDNNI